MLSGWNLQDSVAGYVCASDSAVSSQRLHEVSSHQNPTPESPELLYVENRPHPFDPPCRRVQRRRSKAARRRAHGRCEGAAPLRMRWFQLPLELPFCPDGFLANSRFQGTP